VEVPRNWFCILGRSQGISTYANFVNFVNLYANFVNFGGPKNWRDLEFTFASLNTFEV